MKTKLLVTLGPNSIKEYIIKEIDQYDIFLFRINLSHTPVNMIKQEIDFIKKHTNTPICLDSEGAQIRNQIMKGDQAIFREGDTVTIHSEETEGESKNISLAPNFVVNQLQVGDVLNLDFNSARLRITECRPGVCRAVVLVGGIVGSNKAADLEREIELPAITVKDKAAIKIGRELGISHFALSFASSRQDVDAFRKKVGSQSYIVSKIESKKGLRNVAEILGATDAILIDRGDLSREVPIEQIPFFQRRLVSIAKLTDREVFVATNLLESMVKAKQPTRAEVNDIVSTVLMGATGLVLAAETAIGAYPIDCVRMVRKLTKQCERWTPNTSIDELLDQASML